MGRFAKRYRLGGWSVLSGLFLIGVVCLSIFGEALAPFPSGQQDLVNRLQPPAWMSAKSSHLLGTDHLGRDIFSRLIAGARISVLVSTISVIVAATLGIVLGLAAGYAGGRIDSLLMRLGDMQLALPMILLAIIIIGILGPTLVNMVIVLAMTSWVTYARLVRSEVLVLRSKQFVEAAHALGDTDMNIIRRHILPNTMGVVIVVATLDLGRMIFFESALSFLGLGLPPPSVTWGSMLADGKLYLGTAWWLATLPGLLITLTILATNFLGDWLSDFLDTKTAS